MKLDTADKLFLIFCIWIVILGIITLTFDIMGGVLWLMFATIPCLIFIHEKQLDEEFDELMEE